MIAPDEAKRYAMIGGVCTYRSLPKLQGSNERTTGYLIERNLEKSEIVEDLAFTAPFYT
jgi:hypothetical protein